jgi:hypothetical protein
MDALKQNHAIPSRTMTLQRTAPQNHEPTSTTPAEMECKRNETNVKPKIPPKLKVNIRKSTETADKETIFQPATSYQKISPGTNEF